MCSILILRSGTSLQSLFWLYQAGCFSPFLKVIFQGFCLCSLSCSIFLCLHLPSPHWGCLQTSGEASTFSSPEGSGSVQKQFFLCGPEVDSSGLQSQALADFAGVRACAHQLRQGCGCRERTTQRGCAERRELLALCSCGLVSACGGQLRVHLFCLQTSLGVGVGVNSGGLQGWGRFSWGYMFCLWYVYKGFCCM